MFTVLFTASATKSFQALPAAVQRRMRPKIDALTSEPHPSGSKKLNGTDAYRIRVGDYRIIYEVRGKQLIVLVLRIGHRREVYR